MRILFLGNANNPLLINLAIELRKLRSGLTIDILSESPVTHSESRNAFTAVYALPAGKFFRGIPGLKTVWMALQFKKALKRIEKKYDVVHMFFMHVGYTRSMRLIHEVAPKFIVSIFGSELYRSPELILKELEPLASMADHVTAANQQTLTDFCKRFKVGESKTSIRRFGLKPLDAIVEQKSHSLSEHKVAAGLPANSFVIACGYNASAGQQHESIIESLGRVKNRLPSNYLLVFPLAMGDSSRVQLIRTRLTALGLNYHFIEKYLPDEQLAHFRAASDLMIQVQTSDQLAGAMQEHICAGSLVITGDWLPYGVFDELGIQYWKVNIPEQVGEKVIELIGDLSHNRSRVKGNMEKIVKLSGWQSNVKSWLELYP